jgi:hypothetical protein
MLGYCVRYEPGSNRIHVPIAISALLLQPSTKFKINTDLHSYPLAIPSDLAAGSTPEIEEERDYSMSR